VGSGSAVDFQISIQPKALSRWQKSIAVVPFSVTKRYMKLQLAAIAMFAATTAFSQLEITTGYAINKVQADGFPLHVGYDFKIKNRFYTKSQIGYKYLYHFNNYVEATMKVSIWELHQTLSYEVIKRRKYVLKPNIGFNYRFYKRKAEMVPPLNTLPLRLWVIGLREEDLVLKSTSDEFYNEYSTNNLGYSFQLQNQFRINDKLWFHVTPFLEPDYDRNQNTGGCYIGLIFKKLY